jgi:hypothetical protein
MKDITVIMTFVYVKKKMGDMDSNSIQNLYHGT